MTILVECLISMVLLLTPATAGMESYLPTTWLYEQPFLGGICNNMIDKKNEASILITEHQTLEIIYAKRRYVIPLPPNAMTALSSPEQPRTYRLIYILGEQFARIGDHYKVMVRMGPEEWQ